MKRSFVFLALSVFVAGIGGSFAQEEGHGGHGAGLPKILWLGREDAKPARGAIHNKVEQGYAEFWSKAQVEPFLGMEAVSGNANEVMFVSGYDSFASFEKDFQTIGNTARGPRRTEYDALSRQEAELVNSVRSVIASYRPELSYRSDTFMQVLPKARYMEVLTMRVRPGKDEAFAEGAKLYREAYTKLNLDQPFATYRVLSGAPSGTYLIFIPLNSLRDIDDAMQREGQLMQAMGEDKAKAMMQGAGDVFVSEESDIYAFNPRISYVSKQFAAADPEFWSPHTTTKLATKAAPAEKKAGD